MNLRFLLILLVCNVIIYTVHPFYLCKECPSKQWKSRIGYRGHLHIMHNDGFSCAICEKQNKTVEDLQKHIKDKHSIVYYQCFCGQKVRRDKIANHYYQYFYEYRKKYYERGKNKNRELFLRRFQHNLPTNENATKLKVSDSSVNNQDRAEIFNNELAKNGFTTVNNGELELATKKFYIENLLRT